MKPKLTGLVLGAALVLAPAAVTAQAQPPAAAADAAAARLELQRLLAHIEAQAEATLSDMAELRINRWRAGSQQKREAHNQADSLQRNLRAALPSMVAAVRQAPEGFAPGFQLYRNLNALYDVLGALAQTAGAYGSRREFEALAERVRFFDEARRTLADRLEAMAEARDAELGRLRAAERLRATPPKKIIVDPEPPRRPARKP